MKKYLAPVLALIMVFAMAGCGDKKQSSKASSASAPASVSAQTSSQGEESPAVMTHAEYEEAALDSQVCVETYVQAKQSWWENKATFYTQAEDGAYLLYNMPCSQEEFDKLVPGTKIRVTGYKSEWSGEVEIIEASYEIIDGSWVAEPTDVTALLANEAELIKHQNEFVSFTEMTVAPSIIKNADGTEKESAFLYNWDGSGSDGNDLYFNVTKDGQTYTFTVESYLCDNSTDVYKAVTALNVGDVINMEGYLYWYEGVNPHITSVSSAQ